ncbi:MAG: hypothetical protein IJD65_01320 [Mailhella sp.]|nr:hypothetical protein [Mailhella sp.]
MEYLTSVKMPMGFGESMAQDTLCGNYPWGEIACIGMEKRPLRSLGKKKPIFTPGVIEILSAAP